MPEKSKLLATTCRNRCDYGPSLNVYPGPVFYNGIDAEAVREIVQEHLSEGRVCQRWLFRPQVSPVADAPGIDVRQGSKTPGLG